MTLPWSKLPRSLAGDWRLTQRSPEALAAFVLAWLAADDDGIVWPAGSTTAGVALRKQVARHRPGDDLWALDAVAELVEADLLEDAGDGALRIVDWVDGPQEPDARPASTSADAPPDGPTRRPGRPRKGDAPISKTEGKRRTRFARREGCFRDVPPGVTYEEWTAGKLDGDRRETSPGNSAPPGNSAGKLRRETLAAARASDSGEIENAEKTEEKSTSGAREGRRETTDNPPGNSAGKLDGAAGKLPTEERLSSFDALDVLDRMRKASGGRLATNLHTSTVAGAFATLARDLIAREVTTVDGLVKAAAHVAHDPWVSAQGRLPLARLMANDGKILLDLIAGSTGCSACGSPMASGVFDRPAFPARPKPEPLAVNRPVMSPDEAKVVVGDLAAQWNAERGRAPLGTRKVAGNG